MDETLEYARNLVVAKRNDMLQNARFNLTVQEQRAILYAITQIKPEDTGFHEYEFDIKDFYSVCGIEKDTYTVLKQMLKGLRDKSWTVPIKDANGVKWDTTVSWFNKVRSNEKSGKVKIRFDDDMMPYLLQLSKQFAEQGEFYTTYYLKYVLPMQSKFSPRLYETLKSYQQNNVRWFFKLEDLQVLLCDCDKDRVPVVPKSWSNFAEFKRRVIEPAVKEINEYTDLKISYKAEKENGRYAKITFLMLEKTKQEKKLTEKAIEAALDSQSSVEDPDQLDIFAIALKEHEAALEKEREADRYLKRWIEK